MIHLQILVSPSASYLLNSWLANLTPSSPSWNVLSCLLSWHLTILMPSRGFQPAAVSLILGTWAIPNSRERRTVEFALDPAPEIYWSRILFCRWRLKTLITSVSNWTKLFAVFTRSHRWPCFSRRLSDLHFLVDLILLRMTRMRQTVLDFFSLWQSWIQISRAYSAFSYLSSKIW